MAFQMDRGETMKSSALKKSAFTLIEVLVVMAILAILFSLLLPMLSKTREMAYRTVCLSNLRQIGAAAIRYATDHGDYFPGRTYNAPWPPQVACWGGNDDMRSLWVGYVPGYSIQHSSKNLYCPSNDDPGLLNSTYEAWSVFYPGIYVFGYSYFASYPLPNSTGLQWRGTAKPARKLGDRPVTALWGDVTESYLYSNGEPWSYAAHTSAGGVQWLAPGSKVAPEGMNCAMSDGSAKWCSISVDKNGLVTSSSGVEPCLLGASSPGFYWAKPDYH
jgi:prepilin-type N-terminal cleavage/methylation domain-containing protein